MKTCVVRVLDRQTGEWHEEVREIVEVPNSHQVPALNLNPNRRNEDIADAIAHGCRVRQYGTDSVLDGVGAR